MIFLYIFLGIYLLCGLFIGWLIFDNNRHYEKWNIKTCLLLLLLSPFFTGYYLYLKVSL